MRDYNIVVLGAGGVGKSSVTVRYVEGTYNQSYDPTIEECYTKKYEHTSGTIQLDIVDSAGMDQFKTDSNGRIESSEGFVVVWSLDSPESAQLAGFILSEIRKCRSDPDTPIVVLCNKTDLEPDWRTAGNLLITRFEREYGIRVFRTSARLNKGITEAFDILVDKLLAQWPNGPKRLKKKKSSQWWKSVF